MTTITLLENLSYAELLIKRSELIAKGNGSPSALSDEDLESICSVLALLRRKSSGPPKPKTKATPVAIEQLEL